MNNIVYRNLFFPTSFLYPPIKPFSKTRDFPFHFLLKKKRGFPLPSVASIPYGPINVDYLETEFSGHGVAFSGVGEDCVVKLTLNNGSTTSLMLPTGLITSYKAPMWHGGTLELLHTLVSEEEKEEEIDIVIQGGVSLALKCLKNEGDSSWSPTTWALHKVKGNPQEQIQVELISSSLEGMAEIKHIITLRGDHLSSEIVVSNASDSSLQLLGSIISHLAVSTPEATYALGLEGSDFFSRPPLFSNFSIIPPETNKKNDPGDGQVWGSKAFSELLSTWGLKNQNTKKYTEEEEMEGEEDDAYKNLTQKMSRIYTSAPRSFTILDRGRRNSVVVGRDGFDEMYIFSPGSSHEWYGKFAYICTGQSALLQPITIAPGGAWRGSQHIHNPNL